MCAPVLNTSSYYVSTTYSLPAPDHIRSFIHVISFNPHNPLKGVLHLLHSADEKTKAQIPYQRTR